MDEIFDIRKMKSDRLEFLCRPLDTCNSRMIDTHKLERHGRLNSCDGMPPLRCDGKSLWENLRGLPLVEIGVLNKLPLELLFMIFTNLNIASLCRLRQTNTLMKCMVERWPVLCSMMHYGKPAVRALLATRTARLWRAPQLNAVLLTAECEICGEHGEVLQLLKLTRCCSACLTKERTLLAVPLTYAITVMCLSDESLAKVPRARCIDQQSFWGAPGLADEAVDYTTALEFAEQPRATTAPVIVGSRNPVWGTRCDVKAWAAPRLPTTTGPGSSLQDQNSARGDMTPPLMYVDTTRTGITQEEDQTNRCFLRRQYSKNHYPETCYYCKPSHLRRREWHELAKLHLPDYLTSPPESSKLQFRVSVRVPVILRDTKTNTTHTVTARHCAGCAYFYNYHSLHPYQAHRLYAFDVKDRSSAMCQHLQHCIYARLYFNKLRPHGLAIDPIRELQILNNHRSVGLLFPRHYTDNTETNLAFFELTPFSVRQFFFRHWTDPKYVTPHRRLRWKPVSEIDFSQVAVHLEMVRREDDDFPETTDSYADMLVQPEAISQASWACARQSNAEFLFGSYNALRMEKKARWDRKLSNLDRALTGKWGFEHFS